METLTNKQCDFVCQIATFLTTVAA